MILRAIFTSAALLAASAAEVAAQRPFCGPGIGNAAACRADPTCFGMPYRGESVVPCILDARGFASNCPTAGRTSTPPPTR